MDLLIRFAKMEDAEELLALYTPYVTDTVITFEYEVPSLEEFKDRMRQTMKKYPYLVAEQNGEILGYSCAGAFKGRAAYDWAVETTIYIRKDRQKTGVGKKLYEALEKVLHAQNICNLYACIGYPEIEDKYLTAQELIQDIEELHNHKDVLAGMAEAAEKLGKASAGADIAHMALELAGKKGER